MLDTTRYSRTQLNRFPEHNPGTFNREKTPVTAVPSATETSIRQKRRLIGILAMYMPPEGVNEILDAALNCWNFYADRDRMPTTPTTPPSTRRVKIVNVRTSPGMTFEG